MVHPEVRQTVGKRNSPATNISRCGVQCGHGEKESDVAQGDERRLSNCEHAGGGVQMGLLVARRVKTAALDHAVHTGASVGQNVCRPAQNLVEDKSGDLNNRSVGIRVVHDLRHKGWLLGAALNFGFAVRHENGVFLHVVVVTVMTCVAELPAKERHHQHAVQSPAGNGVDSEVVGERVVAAVVGKNPETGKDASCNETVQSPQGHGNKQRRVELRELDCGIKETAQENEIANNVGERANHGAFEAFGRNGILQGLDIGHWCWLDVGHGSEPCLDRSTLGSGSGRDHCCKEALAKMNTQTRSGRLAQPLYEIAAERQAKNLPLDTTQSKLKRPEIRFNMAEESRAYKTPPFSRCVDARKEWAPNRDFDVWAQSVLAIQNENVAVSGIWPSQLAGELCEEHMAVDLTLHLPVVNSTVAVDDAIDNAGSVRCPTFFTASSCQGLRVQEMSRKVAASGPREHEAPWALKIWYGALGLSSSRTGAQASEA